MKFIVALTALFSVASAISEISSSSTLGRRLLSNARRLENKNDNEMQFNWVKDYSIKFQGCHHIKQWNDDADEDNDVRIETKRLIRFRLCPSDSCSATKAGGCTSGYGDYVIDMASFMEAYFEARRQEIENQCNYQLENVCQCQDNGDDNYNEEYCQYDCLIAADMEECVDRNPYEDDEVEKFEVEEYMECKQLEIQNNKNNNNNNNRKLNEEVQYFVGPYCSNQGGAIHLGLFSDDTCTTAETSTSFKKLAGYELPYSYEDGESLVSAECLSCMEQNDGKNGNDNNNGGNDAQDADQVIEICEQLYEKSGKCEANVDSGTVSYPNNNACNYMKGITIVRNDGIIDSSGKQPSAVATAFIILFALAFIAMGFYVWYLRNRLGVKENTLL